jgi:hypothetical protein
MTGLSRELDVACLLPTECERIVEHAIVIEHIAATIKALAAARATDACGWKRDGNRTPEERLAKQSGISVGAAKRALATGEALAAGGATSEAARSGEISPEQASMITDAATANPSAEQDLLDKAKTGSLNDLDEACTKAKAAADPSPEDTYRRNRAARRLSFWNKDGICKLFGECTPDQMAAIKAAVESRADELFRAARTSGDHEPRQAYLIDALEQICAEWRNGGTTDDDAIDDGEPDADDGDSAKPKTKRRRGGKNPVWIGLVRADLEALRRGHVVGDELCEITGLGPVPVEVARNLLGGDSVLHLVLTNGTAVGTTVNFKRGPNTAQRMALLFTQPHCDITGCNSIFYEIDHVDDWVRTKTTELKGLRRLCKHHHRLKTAGWTVIEDGHQTVIVPPDDPRHPDFNERPPP